MAQTTIICDFEKQPTSDKFEENAKKVSRTQKKVVRRRKKVVDMILKDFASSSSSDLERDKENDKGQQNNSL